MKIKARWGFIGDAEKLKSKERQVRRNDVFDGVDSEYAHLLIGKGLAVEIVAEPEENRQARSPAPSTPAPAVAPSPAPPENKSLPAPAALTDKTALLARAKELGIDAKGNWGVQKLQDEIAAAESAADAAGAAKSGEGAGQQPAVSSTGGEGA